MLTVVGDLLIVLDRLFAEKEKSGQQSHIDRQSTASSRN